MTEQVKIEDVDLDQMKIDAKKLKQSNEAKAEALMRETGRAISPGVLAAIKLEVFIASFLDDNAQTVFDYNLQIRMKSEFEDALRELRQIQLTEGVKTSASKLHIAR